MKFRLQPIGRIYDCPRDLGAVVPRPNTHTGIGACGLIASRAGPDGIGRYGDLILENFRR
jgi:hypothetical protein